MSNENLKSYVFWGSVIIVPSLSLLFKQLRIIETWSSVILVMFLLMSLEFLVISGIIHKIDVIMLGVISIIFSGIIYLSNIRRLLGDEITIFISAVLIVGLLILARGIRRKT